MGFNRETVAAWCGRGILFLVLAMLAFGPLAFGAVYLWTQLVLFGLAVGIGGLWLMQLWLVRRPKLLWPPLGWAVVAFTLYAVARYFMSDIEYVSRLELLRIGLYAFIFFVAVNHLHGQDETKWICYTLIAVAALTSSYAVVQYLHQSNVVWNELSPYAGRASGTYISPNHFGGLLEMILPLALAYLLLGRIHVITRIVLAYAAVTIAAGLTVTFSRGAWLGAGAGVLLLLIILIGQRAYRWRALVLLLILLGGGSLFVQQYLSKTVGYMRRVVKPDAVGPAVLDNASRLQMWQAARQMWQDHFWLGVGPGLYDYRFREYRPEGIQLRPDHAHNDYLNLLADWGTVGGLIVFAGLGIFMVGMGRLWRYIRPGDNEFRSGMSNRFAFYLGAGCGLFALAVHSVTDFNLHIPANALVGVVLLGLLASNVRFGTERFWSHAGWLVKAGVTIVIGLTLACLVVQIRRGSGETQWLARAEDLPVFSPERAAALQKAHASEPKNFETTYNIGECLRTQSLDGGENYAELARQAMNWYAIGIQLNPHDGYNYLRTGMCLDWLDQSGESEKYYAQAELCDPKGYYMIANIGWHYVQIGDYAAARQWFLRSFRLESRPGMAQNYLTEICGPKLLEKAAGQRFPRPNIGEKTR